MVEQPGIFRAKGIIFGDDYMGTVMLEEQEYKNNDGLWMKKFLIMPTAQLKMAYPELQKPNALEHKGIATWREYPKKWVFNPNTSMTWAIVRVDCRFDGVETPHTRRWELYSKEIEMLEKEKENIEIANIELMEKLRDAYGDTKELIIREKEIEELMKGGKSDGREQDNPNEGLD